jgi:hypothetical protein
MNVRKKGRLPPPAAWELEFVQLIAVPTRPPLFIEQHWLQDLVSKHGEEPGDSVSTTTKQSRKDKVGFQGVLLSLTVDLGLVVWEARSPFVADRTGPYPTIGPFREKIDWFVDLLNPWLHTSCPPIIRLAFVAKMLQSAPSPKKAYEILRPYLPVVKLDTTLNDFSLTINRRKPASTVVEGLPINRVSTWSKLNIAMFTEPGKPFAWQEECYGALELNINTAPEKADILPSKLLPQLLRELAELGMRIAVRGDRKDIAERGGSC